MRTLQHRGRLRAEEVRYAVDLITHHRGLRQQVVAVDPPGPGIGARRISQHHQPVRQVPVRINAISAGRLEGQLSPDSFDPDHQLRVGPAAHAVDELQQVQRRLQLLVAQLAESEPGTLTGEVGPPLVHVAVEREDQLTALLSVQAVNQTANSRPHRPGEIRHGELDHAANLAACELR